MSSPPPHAPPFVSRARKPWVTVTILAVNCAIFTYAAGQGAEGEAKVLQYLAQDRPKIWQGEYWRLLTPIFTQTMLFHLASNMFAHVYLGRVMERILGHVGYFVLYLVAGVSGSIVFQLAAEGTGVGASGAVYGVAGAYFLAAYGRDATGEIVPGRRFFRVLALVLLGDQLFAFVIEKSNPAMRIASSAHMGGLVSGLALGYSLIPRPPGAGAASFRRRVIAGCCFGLIFLSAGVYSCLYAVHEKESRILTIQQDIERQLLARRYEAALETWRSLRLEDEQPKRTIGYFLFEQLMGVQRDDLGLALLGDLIHSAESSLEDQARRGEPPSDLLNEVAWYHAVEGSDLQAALKLADEAVKRAKAADSGGWLARWLPRHRKAAVAQSVSINTRGWIRLQLGDSRGAIEDLQTACDLLPEGVNFVYLALAHHRLGHRAEAAAAEKKALELDFLSPYELRLLSTLGN